MLCGLRQKSSVLRKLVTCVEARVLEAALSCLETNSLCCLRAERVIGANVCFVVLGMVGEMALVQFTFPDNSSPYLDFSWTMGDASVQEDILEHFIPGEARHLPDGEDLANIGHWWHHEAHAERSVTEVEGLTMSDLVAFLLQPGDGSAARAELIVYGLGID